MFPTLLTILTCALLYWFPLRRWMSRWGAAPSDLTRRMAGDELLANPTYSGTARILTRTSPDPGSGSGSSMTVITSGPP